MKLDRDDIPLKPHLGKSPRTHLWYCGYRFPYTNLSHITSACTPEMAYRRFLKANIS